MKGIIPHLWFDQEVKEAVELYTNLFEDSKITNIQTLEDTPSGETTIIDFELSGQPFVAINGGPFVTFNQSISLMVVYPTKEEVDEKIQTLLAGGEVVMPLQEYPFSKWYGWVEDRYGLSWQIGIAEEDEIHQRIIPNLLFSGEVIGRNEEALSFYTKIFENSKIEALHRYGEYDWGEAGNPQAEVMFSTFNINGMLFNAMDNGMEEGDKVVLPFSEAFSFMILCGSQEETDYYWEKLSAVPEAEECGWLKDKFGVSWQVVPERMNELLEKGTRGQINRGTQAFLKMKK